MPPPNVCLPVDGSPGHSRGKKPPCAVYRKMFIFFHLVPFSNSYPLYFLVQSLASLQVAELPILDCHFLLFSVDAVDCEEPSTPHNYGLSENSQQLHSAAIRTQDAFEHLSILYRAPAKTLWPEIISISIVCHTPVMQHHPGLRPLFLLSCFTFPMCLGPFLKIPPVPIRGSGETWVWK